MLFDKLFRVLVIGGATAAAAAGCATAQQPKAAGTAQTAQTKAEEEGTAPAQQSPQTHTFRPGGGARGW